MSNNTGEMLKKVILYDAIIILISFMISIIYFREYTPIIVIGIIIAVINFLLNTVITNYSMKVSGGAILIILGAFARIALAGGFVIVIYNGDKMNIIAYLIGYSLHYISIIIYAAARGHKKREKGNK